MLKKNISLSRIEDVKNFVNIAMEYDFDIELASGKYTVDAKSIMGIFSLDLTKPLCMMAHCDEADPLASQVQCYVCDETK